VGSQLPEIGVHTTQLNPLSEILDPPYTNGFDIGFADRQSGLE